MNERKRGRREWKQEMLIKLYSLSWKGRNVLRTFLDWLLANESTRRHSDLLWDINQVAEQNIKIGHLQEKHTELILAATEVLREMAEFFEPIPALPAKPHLVGSRSFEAEQDEVFARLEQLP